MVEEESKLPQFSSSLLLCHGVCTPAPNTVFKKILRHKNKYKPCDISLTSLVYSLCLTG